MHATPSSARAARTPRAAWPSRWPRSAARPPPLRRRPSLAAALPRRVAAPGRARRADPRRRAAVRDPGGPGVRRRRPSSRVEHGTAWVLRRAATGCRSRRSCAATARAAGFAARPAPAAADAPARARRSVRAPGGRQRTAGRLLLRAPVGVGAPRSPSPVGRDEHLRAHPGHSAQRAERARLRPGRRRAADVAARAEPGHPFGGIMAFHGGHDGASVGTASSAGCFRMRNADARRLARLVRAGTPVIIRP